jgi:hypothetical protein
MAEVRPKLEGTVWIEEGGTRYEGSWHLENGVVSLYVGDIGPMSTLAGNSPPDTVARWLLREFLDGRKLPA